MRNMLREQASSGALRYVMPALLLLLTALPGFLSPVIAVDLLPPKATNRKAGGTFRIRRIVPMQNARTARNFQASPGANNSVDSAAAASASKQRQQVMWPTGFLTLPLSYHGGRIMTGQVNVYPIYYGSWFGNFGQKAFKFFVQSLNSRALDGREVPSVGEWWRIMAPYYQTTGGKKVYLAPKVALGKQVVINKGFKKVLRDGQSSRVNDIENIVLRLIRTKVLPEDPKGFYAVITSGDIFVGDSSTGFCGAYCGWHFKTPGPTGKLIKYGFIGDGSKRCNEGCGANAGLPMTANGFYGMDSLMSTFAHELAETASNPDVLTGWWAESVIDDAGYENGDLCAGEYGNIWLGLSQRFAFNLQGLAGRRYLIQTNVDVKGQACVLRR